jgi:hypothetical protein
MAIAPMLELHAASAADFAASWIAGTTIETA